MNKVNRYFKLAKSVASKNDRRRYRLGAVGIRTDGTIVTSTNIPCPHPEKYAHAEARLARKLDYGSEVFVVRILKCGTLANARPCLSCQATLSRLGVKRIYYSISNSEYGVMTRD